MILLIINWVYYQCITKIKERVNIKDYIIYCHISPNGKRYYGITGLEPNKRWRNGTGYSNNKYFSNSINKYGWNNFKHIIVSRGLTEDEAKWLEIQLISAHNSANRKYGYNISLGGESAYGYNHTQESKQKISEVRKGKYYGENNNMFGKHHTDEAKAKIGKAHSGENNYMYGKYGKLHPKSKKIICITTKRFFYGIKEAGEFYNIKAYAHITNCCKGRIKSCGKYNNQKLIWRYINVYHNKILRGSDINKLHKRTVVN